MPESTRTQQARKDRMVWKVVMRLIQLPAAPNRGRLENVTTTTWIPLFFVTTRNRRDLGILWNNHYSKCPRIGRVSSYRYYAVVRPHGNQGYKSCTECKAELAVKILRMQKWKDFYLESCREKHLSWPLCNVKVMQRQLFETEDFWTTSEQKN